MKTYTIVELRLIFSIGLILGLVLGLMFADYMLSYNYIKPCELDLPRNQNCVIIAVPEKWNPEKPSKK